MTKRKKSDQVKEQLTPYPENEPEFLSSEYERYEIIEGVRYDLQPAPTVVHQKISASIFISLHETCHTVGTILYSPIAVYFDEDNQFQPDLVFIRHENEDIITEKRIEGAPDLVLEILSPSTSQNDKISKKRQYERNGVSEFWIADPVHRTVDQFILMDDRYQLRETFGQTDLLTSPLFTCISIDLTKVFPLVKKDVN